MKMLCKHLRVEARHSSICWPAAEEEKKDRWIEKEGSGKMNSGETSQESRPQMAGVAWQLVGGGPWHSEDPPDEWPSKKPIKLVVLLKIQRQTE